MNKKYKSKTKKISLKERLDRIYNSVNLKTTCCNQTVCCKIGCPQMNFSEFTSLITKLWDSSNKADKIEMICKSVEYFFHNEFEKFGMETMIKPCMLLNEGDEGKGCSCYENRPLSCRMYGLWPEEMYRARVDKFEKAYEGLLKRDELPLNTQCPNVKRVDDSQPLTKEIIEDLYKQLDDLDFRIGGFTKAQIDNRENYRTFHDWLLLKVLGEDRLVLLTTFMKAAKKETIEAQVETLKQVLKETFEANMPNPKI